MSKPLLWLSLSKNGEMDCYKLGIHTWTCMQVGSFKISIHYSVLYITNKTLFTFGSSHNVFPQKCKENKFHLLTAWHGGQCDMLYSSRSVVRDTVLNCWTKTASIFNISGIKEYWSWWGWRWRGRGEWPDPASSSVCTKKSYSRVQAGLSRNIPSNNAPND